MDERMESTKGPSGRISCIETNFEQEWNTSRRFQPKRSKCELLYGYKYRG